MVGVRAVSQLLVLSLLLFLTACGGGSFAIVTFNPSESPVQSPTPPPITITIFPAMTFPREAHQQFIAKVTEASDINVKWSTTSATFGGSTAIIDSGKIFPEGVIVLFDASKITTLPMPPTVTITATAIADPTQSATITIALVVPPNRQAQVLPIELGTSGGNVNDFAMSVKEKYEDNLLSEPAVIGVGLTYSKKTPGEPTITVYVERDEPHNPIPTQLDGIEVQVLESRRLARQ